MQDILTIIMTRNLRNFIGPEEKVLTEDTRENLGSIKKRKAKDRSKKEKIKAGQNYKQLKGVQLNENLNRTRKIIKDKTRRIMNYGIVSKFM